MEQILVDDRLPSRQVYFTVNVLEATIEVFPTWDALGEKFEEINNSAKDAEKRRYSFEPWQLDIAIAWLAYQQGRADAMKE